MMKDQVQIQARNSLNVATANMVLNVMRIQKMRTRKYLIFAFISPYIKYFHPCSNPVILNICCIIFYVLLFILKMYPHLLCYKIYFNIVESNFFVPQRKTFLVITLASVALLLWQLWTFL